eukprot:gene5771-6010_t
MLPLSLLKTAQAHPVLVELKTGETYNGHLVNCDSWMNIHLREVICTSKDGDRFWRLPEIYIRGNTLKYIRVPEEVVDKVKEEAPKRGSYSAEEGVGVVDAAGGVAGGEREAEGREAGAGGRADKAGGELTEV